MSLLAAADPPDLSHASPDTTWNTWALAPAHVVGLAAWWGFLRWMVPALDPAGDATSARAAFGLAVALATVTAAVVGARLARLGDAGSAARHGAFSGVIVVGWIAWPAMCLLPLRAAFSPANAPGDGLMTQDELGAWMSEQALRMFQASNQAMWAAVGLVALAAAAAAVGRGTASGPSRASGRVTGTIALFSTWALVFVSAIALFASLAALGSLDEPMLASLGPLRVSRCLGLNRLEQFMAMQALWLAAASLSAASRLRAGPPEQRVERVATGVVLGCFLGVDVVALSTIPLQGSVRVAVGVIMVATAAGTLVRARRGQPPRNGVGASSPGALIVWVLSVLVAYAAIVASNVSYGLASMLSSVAWIKPLTKDVSAPRPSWPLAADEALRTVQSVWSPGRVVLTAVVAGLLWTAGQRVALVLIARERARRA